MIFRLRLLEILFRNRNGRGISSIPLGSGVHLVHGYDEAIEILSKDGTHFHKGANLDLLRILLGKGLLLLESTEHKYHRDAIRPLLVLDEGKIIAQINKEIENLPSAGRINFPQFTDELYMKIICRLLFGTDDISLFRKLAQKTLKIATRAAWISVAEEELLDLLQSWKLAINLAGDNGIIAPMAKVFSRDEIIHEVITLFMAGHETISSASSWLIYARWKNRISSNNVVGLINETLRLYPPAWIFYRSPIKAIDINGVMMREGSVILICPFLIHRNRKNWINPNQFNPERKMSAFIPFSKGIRGCIGASMAMKLLNLFAIEFYKNIKVLGIRNYKNNIGIVLRSKFFVNYVKESI